MRRKPKPAPIPHGKGYRLHYYLNGKQHRCYVSTEEAVANKLQSMVNSLITEYKNGLLEIPEEDLAEYIFSQVKDPDPEFDDLDDEILLSELIERYLIHLHKQEETKEKAPNTIKTEKVHIGNFQKFLQKEKRNLLVLDIRISLFDDYKHFRAKQGVLAKSINKELKTLQLVFKFAVREGYAQHNIVRDVEKLKAEAAPRWRTIQQVDRLLTKGDFSEKEEKRLKRFRYLSPDEIEELYKTAQKRLGKEHWLLPVLEVFVYTGLRKGELCKLAWIDIDFENDLLYIKSRKQSTKIVEVEREVDMHPRLKNTLLKQEQKTGESTWVFPDPSTGEQLDKHRLRRVFRRVIRGTKFEGIGFHAFRHSFVTLLSGIGEDARIVGDIVGHTTEAQRELYRHPNIEQRKAAIHKLPNLDDI